MGKGQQGRKEWKGAERRCLHVARGKISKIQGKRGRGRRKSAGWKSLLLREEVGGTLQREAQGTLPLRPRPEREMYMRRVLQGPGEA